MVNYSMNMKHLAAIALITLALSGCMSEKQATYVKQLNQDYQLVVSNGERVSTITQTFLGGRKVDFDIFKYEGSIWRCRHDGGGECHRQ